MLLRFLSCPAHLRGVGVGHFLRGNSGGRLGGEGLDHWGFGVVIGGRLRTFDSLGL